MPDLLSIIAAHSFQIAFVASCVACAGAVWVIYLAIAELMK